jgi:hypothetical protein
VPEGRPAELHEVGVCGPFDPDVELAVPDLPAGDRLLRLAGLAETGSYAFAVVDRPPDR